MCSSASTGDVLPSLEDLLSLATDLGVSPVRDIGLLDGAAHRPQVELYGEQAYPDPDTKAAVEP